MGNNSRYTAMQTLVTRVLLINTALFLLYLIVAAAAIIWLKVIFTIFIFLISICVLAFLYLCGELLRKRSRWMSAWAAAVFVCTLFSIVLNYPSPV